MRTIRSALLVLGLALAGCQPAPTQPAPEPAPALWRIADEDSEIWLFGTVHILPRDVVWRSERVNAAFAAADEFVTETDTGPAATAEFQALTQQLGAMPPGENLLDQLDTDSRARLERLAREAGFEPQQFATVRPWLAAMQISYFHAAQRGHEAEAGVEAVLGAEAASQNKRHSFLETPAEQIHILADLPHADQLRFLQATLRQIEQEAGVLDEMDDAWARGELDALGEQLDAQIGEAGPAVHQALIIDRNRAWANEIAARLNGEGRTFIAVGAAHLVGDNSVVAMLRERGIEVEGP
jgi:uncharacterized protein